MVEWGGHHGGWGGFGPPSYIVKKCPDIYISMTLTKLRLLYLYVHVSVIRCRTSFEKEDIQRGHVQWLYT
jgi:hypothetical protein